MKFTPGSQNVSWEQTYGTSNTLEKAKAVAEHNGDLFFAGVTKKPGSKEIFIVQVDSANGNVKNNKYIGSGNRDEANDIIET